MSLSLLVHYMSLGFGWAWGQNRFLLEAYDSGDLSALEPCEFNVLLAKLLRNYSKFLLGLSSMEKAWKRSGVVK